MYREHELPCPECGVALVALVALDTRDKWRCKQCAGVLVGMGQLEVELGDGGRDLVYESPRTRKRGTRACPACRSVMEPTKVLGIELDRCVQDGYVWFDRGELGHAAQRITSDVDAAAAAFLAALVR